MISETAIRPASKTQHDIAFTRAGAAVIWAIIYYIAVHGRHVLSGSDIPKLVGLLLVIYPMIDTVSCLSQWRLDGERPELRIGLVLDVLTIIVVLVATLGLHTGAVLGTFGAWAILSGLLQLTVAWRADRSRRIQLPLILSGGISVIAGVTSLAMVSSHYAKLSNPVRYAVLGAAFFVIWTVIDRRWGNS